MIRMNIYEAGKDRSPIWEGTVEQAPHVGEFVLLPGDGPLEPEMFLVVTVTHGFPSDIPEQQVMLEVVAKEMVPEERVN